MVSQDSARMEPDFRLLFESVPGLFLVLSPEFYIVGASDAYLQATLTRREQVLGRHLFDVFPDNPDDPNADGVANLRRSLERVVATRVPDAMALQKYDVARPDGSGFEERYWSPSNFPVFDGDGKLRYIMHRAEDVSAYVLLRNEVGQPEEAVPQVALPAQAELEWPALEPDLEAAASTQHLHALNRALKLELLARKALADTNIALTQELKHNIEKLQESNKELESFSYSVSHDLRAPLRAIDGFARMLEEDVAEQLDDDARRKLDVIRNNTRNMGRLIDELLEFSRLGRKEINLGRLDMTTLARAAFETVTGRDEQGSEVLPRVELVLGGLPDSYGDITLVKQVWFNLISNAVKFSAKRDAARISINGSAAPEDADMLLYSVRDNGAGFDMRYYNKLFGVFQRLHRVSEFEGTGVGLAIVHRIVTRHGGRIWAEGVVGEGAVFYFTLPRDTRPPLNHADRRSNANASV